MVNKVGNKQNKLQLLLTPTRLWPKKKNYPCFSLTAVREK